MILFILFACVLYVFVGGDNGLFQIWHLNRWIGALEREILALEEERSLLERERHLLETDVEIIEKHARERYGMIKEGETIFEVHPSKKKP
ncbi:MAG: septum formation initiator family protein [Candidatus Latescibacterota bacterium]